LKEVASDSLVSVRVAFSPPFFKLEEETTTELSFIGEEACSALIVIDVLCSTASVCRSLLFSLD
jgi:hypothetical protein